MKKIIIIILLVVVAVLAAVLHKDTLEYQNIDLGISFEYPKTYRLEERQLGDGHRGHLSLMLIDKDFVPVEGGEGPPTINIDLYQNPNWSEPLAWVQNEPRSNFQLSNGKFEERMVARRTAVLYKSDGLYQTENVVLKNRDYIAHMSVGYLTSDDKIRRDFQEVLNSVEFQ
jgi:hypothetical protein